MSPSRASAGPVGGTTGLEIASFGYHEVTDDHASSGFQRRSATAYKHSRHAFERNLDAIALAPTAPTLVTEVAFDRPGSHVLLTFDDGGTSALAASELLAARGWRGHFFVVTSLIDTPRFLDRAGLRQLRAAGHLIGSHTHTHPAPFRTLAPSRQLAEWRESCDRIAQLLGEPCVTASVPGGDVSAAVYDLAAEAGIVHLFTSDPSLAPQRVASCWVLGRFMPKASTPAARVGELARFEGWPRALLVRRIRVLLKRMFPSPYRVYARARSRAPVEGQ